MCQFCYQQWQKSARIHSDDMAVTGVWGCSRDEERTQSQLQSGFCCYRCCRAKGKHPGVSAVSPREVQRACDEDVAVVFVLPVRQSASQFAFEGGEGRELQGSESGWMQRGSMAWKSIWLQIENKPLWGQQSGPTSYYLNVPCGIQQHGRCVPGGHARCVQQQGSTCGKSGCRRGSWLGVRPR